MSELHVTFDSILDHEPWFEAIAKAELYSGVTAQGTTNPDCFINHLTGEKGGSTCTLEEVVRNDRTLQHEPVVSYG